MVNKFIRTFDSVVLHGRMCVYQNQVHFSINLQYKDQTGFHAVYGIAERCLRILYESMHSMRHEYIEARLINFRSGREATVAAELAKE